MRFPVPTFPVPQPDDSEEFFPADQFNLNFAPPALRREERLAILLEDERAKKDERQTTALAMMAQKNQAEFDAAHDKLGQLMEQLNAPPPTQAEPEVRPQDAAAAAVAMLINPEAADQIVNTTFQIAKDRSEKEYEEALKQFEFKRQNLAIQLDFLNSQIAHLRQQQNIIVSETLDREGAAIAAERGARLEKELIDYRTGAQIGLARLGHQLDLERMERAFQQNLTVDGMQAARQMTERLFDPNVPSSMLMQLWETANTAMSQYGLLMPVPRTVVEEMAKAKAALEEYERGQREFANETARINAMASYQNAVRLAQSAANGFFDNIERQATEQAIKNALKRKREIPVELAQNQAQLAALSAEGDMLVKAIDEEYDRLVAAKQLDPKKVDREEFRRSKKEWRVYWGKFLKLKAERDALLEEQAALEQEVSSNASTGGVIEVDKDASGRISFRNPNQPSRGGINRETRTGLNAQVAVELEQEAIGKPYTWGGDTLGEGVDCSGLICEYLARRGYKNIPRVTTAHLFSSPPKGFQAVDVESLAPGDIIVYRRSNQTGHTGIVMPDGTVMHASSSAGKVIKTPLKDFLAQASKHKVKYWRP